MRVPIKVDYGVRALVDLAVHADAGPVQTAEIAQRQGIPAPYLDQLLTTLNKFGFVNSRRGPQGGHTLARPPQDVSVGEIKTTLDGNAPILECIQEPSECSIYDACVQRDVWVSVEEAIQSVLGSITIYDLAQRHGQLISVGA